MSDIERKVRLTKPVKQGLFTFSPGALATYNRNAQTLAFELAPNVTFSVSTLNMYANVFEDLPQ